MCREAAPAPAVDPIDAERCETALVEALAAFEDVPGVTVERTDSHVEVAAAFDAPFVQNIVRPRFTPATADDVIDTIRTRRRATGHPATWWISEASTPPDLPIRLVSRGAVRLEVELGMARTLHRLPASTPGARPDLSLDRVTGPRDLEAWIGAMAASYGWDAPERWVVMRRLYDPAAPAGATGRTQVIVRRHGMVVGCGSLFETRAGAWLTNIGVLPDVRRGGIGRWLTLELLTLARARGHETVRLVASALGAPVYGAIGFRTETRFDRYRLA